MATHYSTYFGIPHEVFMLKGTFDACIDNDSLLHVDPLLLKNCKIKEFKDAYNNFFAYFKQFIPLTQAAKEKKMSDPFFKKMVSLFTLSELPNTGLGFSNGTTHGRGISGHLSQKLAQSAFNIIKAGMLDPEIFGLMELIEDEMAADRISDMTLAILQRTFLRYTVRIAKELDIPTKTYRYKYDEYFDVPFYNDKPIYFIPMVILSDLPKAIDFDDIERVCNYNNLLKQKLAQTIGITWAQYKDYKKNDWKNIILGDSELYKQSIEWYKALQGIPYDFSEDTKNQYSDILLSDIVNGNPLPIINHTDTQQQVYSITMEICKQFKHLVEDNRISELFYRKKRVVDETDWQLLLYTVADTYKVAGHLDIAITREDNPGVGEIDFHITKGARANTVIEIKRSCNKDIFHGYRTQLNAYMRAENAADGIFIIIMEDPNIEQIRSQIQTIQEDMKLNNEYIPEIIYINGQRQVSASNSKYTPPNLD